MAMNKRLAKELQELQGPGALPFAKEVSLVGDNMFKWKVILIGPDKTPYEKGTFQLDMDIPADYPFKPPKVKFSTKIYHPNVKSDGSVCHEMLHDGWSPQLKLSEVLLMVNQILKEPNPENPLEPEIANQYKADRNAFNKQAKEWTKKCVPDRRL